MMFRPVLLIGLPILIFAGAAQAREDHPPLDPACFAAVAWEVDPASEPIQVFGCRDSSDIAKPDAQGWITYTRPSTDGSDQGFIRAKLDSISADDVWTFTVQDNGGGSGTFQSIVTGEPDGNGIIGTDGLKVEATPGD